MCAGSSVIGKLAVGDATLCDGLEGLVALLRDAGSAHAVRGGTYGLTAFVSGEHADWNQEGSTLLSYKRL